MVALWMFAVALEALGTDFVIRLLVMYQFKMLDADPVVTESAFRKKSGDDATRFRAFDSRCGT
jgi:hypothetical protein